jgi:hypothetical protein
VRIGGAASGRVGLNDDGDSAAGFSLGVGSFVAVSFGAAGTWIGALHNGQSPARPAQSSATFNVCPAGQVTWMDMELQPAIKVGGHCGVRLTSSLVAWPNAVKRADCDS